MIPALFYPLGSHLLFSVLLLHFALSFKLWPLPWEEDVVNGDVNFHNVEADETSNPVYRVATHFF